MQKLSLPQNVMFLTCGDGRSHVKIMHEKFMTDSKI